MPVVPVEASNTGLIAPALFVCLFSSYLWSAPPRTNQVEAGEHLIAVVPMAGSGTLDDPRRPMFAPARQDIATAIAIVKRR